MLDGYLSGFGAAMASEALAGALPRNQNSPRRPPYGLYAEQLNGTPFTVRRAENRRTWFYRIRPSYGHSPLVPVDSRIRADFRSGHVVPDLNRWKPLPEPEVAVDFVGGLSTFGGNGDPESRSGYAIHLYTANTSMEDACLYNADGDFLVVPQRGALEVLTEFGTLQVAPGEFFVIQRGMKFSVQLRESFARGYVLEIFNGHFALPERGPIGANGLADERHFLTPQSRFEEREVEGYQLFVKHGGTLFRGTMNHSPYDVVAWHGNYAPYKFSFSHFNAMGTVTFDHPDPSIFTVLNAPMDEHGRSVADFAVFPGRWEVAEHTLRPPYYHRNAATEFNGVVSASGPYLGFDPGCYFLTPPLTAHGIANQSYEHHFATSDEKADAPVRTSDDSLWIMFESAMGIRLTDWALESSNRDEGFRDLFANPVVHFDPKLAPQG